METSRPKIRLIYISDQETSSTSSLRIEQSRPSLLRSRAVDGLSWTDAVQDASKQSKNVKVYNGQMEINEIRASLIKSTPSKNSNVIKSNLLGLNIVADS